MKKTISFSRDYPDKATVRDILDMIVEEHGIQPDDDIITPYMKSLYSVFAGGLPCHEPK